MLLLKLLLMLTEPVITVTARASHLEKAVDDKILENIKEVISAVRKTRPSQRRNFGEGSYGQEGQEVTYLHDYVQREASWIIKMVKRTVREADAKAAWNLTVGTHKLKLTSTMMGPPFSQWSSCCPHQELILWEARWK
eukprot:gnl/MRDRNA2_/MRDRNA2_70391_c0_seq1.p1 gnl/MRDRNA2_/MRDRNA2_70391_c0~~gnl/MRDRNA2_/MRDRNA2_70391_c0_seq1.p1  ORF type:complete len:138 (-),score=22.90 gnl/MRDRNA2_/MRDRNA2_70391_c0_seq1:349-762(-)